VAFSNRNVPPKKAPRRLVESSDRERSHLVRQLFGCSRFGASNAVIAEDTRPLVFWGGGGGPLGWLGGKGEIPFFRRGLAKA